jgi:glyoxylase-like metal-dependent hydrolase (beta-lactamase superfamily II)
VTDDLAVTFDRAAWSRPGVEQVTPDIYRIPLPLPNDALRAVNVYLVTEPGGPFLVDGGWALAAGEEALRTGLKSIGYALPDITQILVTHIHRDHYTLAVAIRRRHGTPVSLGAGERPGLEYMMAHVDEPLPRPGQLELLKRQGAGQLAGRLERTRSLTDPRNWQLPDRWLDDGESVTAGRRTLDVIATPGHTRGHVVYRDAPAGLLFAGDHVLPLITPSIAVEAERAPYPLRDYLDSLAVIRALPDTRLLPAHGPVAPSTHKRVDELLEHHRARLEAMLAAALPRAPATAFDVASALTWTRHERALDELDPRHQMLAVSETAAHLDVLTLEGKLARARSPEGTETYVPA